MSTLKRTSLRQIALLAGAGLVSHVDTIAAEETASFGIRVTIVRGCTLDFNGTASAGNRPYANVPTVPAVTCGNTPSSGNVNQGSIPLSVPPVYQLSSDTTHQTVTVTF
ncbi:MAG: hypothetical protein ACLPXB_17250 [Thiobacillaceae bacterium]